MGQCLHSKQVAEELLEEDLEDMRNAWENDVSGEFGRS